MTQDLDQGYPQKVYLPMDTRIPYPEPPTNSHERKVLTSLLECWEAWAWAARKKADIAAFGRLKKKLHTSEKKLGPELGEQSNFSEECSWISPHGKESAAYPIPPKDFDAWTTSYKYVDAWIDWSWKTKQLETAKSFERVMNQLKLMKVLPKKKPRDPMFDDEGNEVLRRKELLNPRDKKETQSKEE